MAGAPVSRTIAPDTPGRRPRKAGRSMRSKQTARQGALESVRSQSLLDVVDNLIDKGLALDAEVVLGLADIDLIYLRAGALVAAADRVFPRRRAGALAPAAPRRLKPALYDRSNRSAGASAPAAPRRLKPTLDDPSNGRAGALAPATPRRLKPTLDDQSTSPVVPAALPSEDATSRSVIRLVLTLIEFVRELLERQAVRRVREQTLTPEEIERLGTALMRLEATVHELAERYGLDPADLNLDLGPLGT